jgi:hypothetical protein
VVKARLRDCPPETIAVTIIAAFERNHQIEVTPGHLALASRDHARAILTFRHTHAAFMRVRRKVFNHPGRCAQ